MLLGEIVAHTFAEIFQYLQGIEIVACEMRPDDTKMDIEQATDCIEPLVTCDLAFFPEPMERECGGFEKGLVRVDFPVVKECIAEVKNYSLDL